MIVIRFTAFVRRMLTVATVSIPRLRWAAVMIALLVGGPFVYHLYVDSPIRTFDVEADGAFSDTLHHLAPREVVVLPEKVRAVREVHIANNGLVLLRGARVVSISGRLLQVAIAWNSTDFIWLVQTSAATKFLTPDSAEQPLDSLHVGDVVSITGTLSPRGAWPTIDAKFVRE